MKNILFFCLLAAITCNSCSKDEIQYSDFRFDVNNVSVISEGCATENIFDTATFFAIQNVTKDNSSKEIISLSGVPRNEQESIYSYNDISVVLCTADSITQTAYTYTAIAGKLTMSLPVNRIVEGDFDFDFVCSDKSRSDTLRISNGHFKITHSTIWIN
jgi:hypothetical protein